MAKRLAVAPQSAPLALLALLLAPNALAEVKVTPTLDLRTTYSDNINLRPEAEARAQFVTELAPGLSLFSNTPRLKLSASLQRHFYKYSDEEVPNTQGASSSASAAMKATLIDELLFFDATGAIAQHAISAFGPQVSDNAYLTSNRSQVKTWSASPYLLHRFGNTAQLNARYTHDSVESNSTGLGDSKSDGLALNLASVGGLRRFGWSTSLARSRITNSRTPTSTNDNASVTLSYGLSSAFTGNATLGYDSYDYDSLGGRTAGRSYNLGFAWNPSLRTSLTASAGRRYYGSSYLLHALHRSRHTVWSLNYDDAVTTTRAQFLLPATIDTAAMLDRLFTANIADPVARAQAVQAYIRATGLPAALADNINYFSNRYILQKQAQASVAFNGARSTAILTYADTRRNALSSVQADSQLQGTSSFNLNDNVHMKSASATLNYRLSARSGVNLSWTATDSTSNTTGENTDFRAVRLSMTRQFMQRLRGEVEVRRVSGNQLGAVGAYRENAISASLNMQF